MPSLNEASGDSLRFVLHGSINMYKIENPLKKYIYIYKSLTKLFLLFGQKTAL